MSRSTKRITLYDVAAAAGVSHQTVSRVINDYPHISEKTRKKVLRAIRELDYQPNRAAQVLNTQRSYMLEVVTSNIWHSSEESIAAMAATARRLGYQITISTIESEDLESWLDQAPSRIIDGIVLSAELASMNETRLAQIAHSVPLVKLRGEPAAQIATVLYDQNYGTRIAVEHLIALGHRQIAAISGPAGLYDARARYETWHQTLQAHNLTPGPSASGSFTEQSGYEAMQTLFESGEPFSAVFASNDSMAMGAMFAIFERGLRVPEDVSIVGFDDSQAAPFFTAPLTTVRQANGVIGQLAIEYLVLLVEQPETPIYQRVLLPELVVRQSTRQLEDI